jgi:hypothetical protein
MANEDILTILEQRLGLLDARQRALGSGRTINLLASAAPFSGSVQ